MSNTKYAWIENTYIRDVCTQDPNELFHSDIAALYNTVVSEEAEAGDFWVNDKLVKGTPPEVHVPPSILPIIVSAVSFKLLFTAEERATLKTNRPTDVVIDDLFDIIEDPRLTEVNLSSETVQSSLTYFVTKGYITAARKQQILNGETPVIQSA
jgi:hypothetical protein